MNDSRLAFFTSAFDDTAVTANPPRSSSCVISCLDAFEGFAARSRASPGTGPAAAQLTGGVTGTFAAHLMFGQAVLQISEKLRDGPAQWFSEFAATFGLLLTIFGTLRFRADAVPFTVGLYISSAYWFTASTSFANPAVTVARALSNTFAGISPEDAPAFIAAQILSALSATLLASWLFQPRMAEAMAHKTSARRASQAAE